MVAITPTVDDVNIALVAFLASVLPDGAIVVQGQINRVPEPQEPNYVVFWPVRRPRLSTNLDAYVDVRFTGSISGLVLTVTEVSFGTIVPGSTLLGVAVAPNTLIGAQDTGTPGGVGTYAIGPTQTLSSRVLAAGSSSYTQATEGFIQVDVHGPLGTDWAVIISTMFRDEYAIDQFASSGFPLAPLYAEDPIQLPFVNAEQQYEDRWVVGLVLQINSTILLPQQFADSADVTLLNVEAEFPT